MESMYEKLMELPLFQGVSRDKLSELIEKTPFHFIKFEPGQEIIAPGDLCSHIRFIISGDVEIEIENPAKRVSISETISGPNVIGPDFLFGRDTFYPFRVKAKSECGILQIIKADYINILQKDKVFLFNLLNMLSRNSQKGINGIMSLTTGSIAERLSFIIISLTHRGSKNIIMKFKQKDLCSVLGAQRSSLINALVKMKEDNIIDFTVSDITIKSREKLLDILHSDE